MPRLGKKAEEPGRTVLDKTDIILQIVLTVVALTVVNHMIYHDSLIVSVGGAVALTAFFWLGRISVMLYRRRRKSPGLADDG